MARSISALSTSTDAKTAVEEVCAKIDAAVEIPIAVLFFASTDIFAEAAKLLYDKYPMATSVGSTTYINIINNKRSNKGLSVMAIFSGIEASAGYLEEISRHPMNYKGRVNEALEKLSSFENTVCIEFTPAYMVAEELVLDTYNEVLKDKGIPVAGSSSGNSYGDKYTYVAINGKVFSDCSVFMLIHNLEGGIACYRENIYKPTAKTLTVTDADVTERRIYEFNDKPAYLAMKEALGVEGKKAAIEISTLPIGRMENGEIQITDVSTINDDNSLTYYARVYNMTKVALLELDDINRVWSETVANCKKLIPTPSFALAVNCAGRTRMIEEKHLLDAYTEMISDNFGTVINVSGFGEQLRDSHCNQTLVLVVFE